MLTQLLQAGVITGIKAIAVGAMEKCDSPNISWKEPILRIANELNIPVVYGINAGHAGFNTFIKLGSKAIIDLNKKEFQTKD
jgi:muramoyltetrapeptide carboxypeptidase LdcA involved in peptidoglycan recycling